jgi:hypothetical protein
MPEKPRQAGVLPRLPLDVKNEAVKRILVWEDTDEMAFELARKIHRGLADVA